MGLRYRGRTKGKGAWLNYSWSDRGLNMSLSAKAGPFTWNSGNKRHKSRVTTNLPGGFYHVSYSKDKRNTNKSTTPNHTSGRSFIGTLVKIVLFCGVFGAMLLSAMYYWWLTSALIVAVLLIGLYKTRTRREDDSLVHDFETTSEEDQQSLLDLAEAAEAEPESVRSFLRTNLQASDQDIDDMFRQLKALRKKHASL